MPLPARLDRQFYEQPALAVARQLLGMRLVRLEDGRRIAGILTETEAYSGESDLGCHARAGRTPRTQVLYGQPGHAYIYFTYGMHWMLNFVAEPEDAPAAVLVRAVQPVEGLDIIAGRRNGRPPVDWTNGPAKLCQAFDIDGRLNGIDVCSPESVIFVEKEQPVPDSSVTITARVGLNSVPEPWKSIPWRFFIDLPVNNE
ncbi:MAG: DNA-3-methyladenine glycosylase [Omnitrophica WOR_2 bacterium]